MPPWGDQARQRGHLDYTDEVRDFVLFYRNAEAQAEIDGFNAVVSKLKQQGAPVTLDQIYNAAPDQMRDFIDA